MKLFLSIEFLSLLLLIVSQWIDWNSRQSQGYSDGGFTWHYTISRAVRKRTGNMAWASLAGMVIGVLALIWNN